MNLTPLGRPARDVTEQKRVHIKGLKKLTALDLDRSKITIAGMKHFQGPQ